MLRLLTLARDVTSITFTPDGAHLLAVFNDDTWEDAVGVAWIDPRTGLSDHVAGVMHAAAVAVIPDGSGFVYAVRPEAAMLSGLFRVYNAETGQHRQILWNTDRPASLVSVARAARVFAFDSSQRSTFDNPYVRVWDDAEGRLRTVRAEYAGTVALSPDGGAVAASNLRTRAFGVWNVQDGSGMRTLPAVADRLTWPHPDRLVAFGPTGLSVWDANRPDPELEVEDVGVELLCADVSPDGRWVIAGGADGVARVWGIGNPEPAASFAWDVGAIRGVAFAPDGLTCAAAGERGRVVLWDFEA